LARNIQALKNLLPIFLFFVCFHAMGQSYQANNEVALFIKEKNEYRIFYSKALFVKINLETSDFLFQVDFNTFKTLDTNNKLSLQKIFPPQTMPNICFKGTMNFNSLDKDIATKQVITMVGSLILANQTFPISLPVEFEFMDKQLLFDTYFNVDLSKFNVVLPLEYKDKLDPTFLMRIDNGHFLKRE
jgi:hypothetical protein